MILAAAIFAATATNAVAQDATSYAPEAGDFSVEVQFNPFSNNFETFQIDGLKGRYHFTDKDALRFGIGFGVNNVKYTPDPENNEDNYNKTKSGNFSIDLGYERHFFNYKRVDLYAGAALGYALQTVKGVDNFVSENGDVFEKEIINGLSNNPSLDERAFNEFNVKLFTGIDFYVYKGLFVGAELGVKFGCRNYPGIYTKGAYTDYGWSNDKESDKMNKVSEISLKTYIEPALRLGWAF